MTYSVVLLSLGLMLATWLLVCLIGHGYSNSIDWVALVLHKHAAKMRGMHDRRKKVIGERWIQSLEQSVIDVLEETKFEKEER